MGKWLAHVPRVEARAALLSLGVGIALTGLKFLAFFLTDSTAIFSDALESIVNVAAAGFATYSLALAHTPADAAHPYGHGKVEFLSAAFEGGMILLAAGAAIIKAAGDLVRGPDLLTQRLDLGLGIMALALLVNGAVGSHLVRTGRRNGSITLEADGRHLLSDALTSVVAVVGLGIVRLTGWGYADPLAALIVSAYIAVIGVRLLRRASAGLMDQQDAEDDQLLRRLLEGHVGTDGAAPRVCGFHKVRHRHSGRHHWVEFHLVVPAGWTIDRGHQAATDIEHEIERALGQADATAHVEPCHDQPCPLCAAPR